MASAVLGLFSRNAAAAIIHTGWNGYGGNDKIYGSTALQSGINPYIIPTISNGQVQDTVIGDRTVHNGINVMAGQDAATTTTDAQFMAYYVTGSQPYLLVDIPIATGTGTDHYYDPTYNGHDTVYYQNVALSVQGSYSPLTSENVLWGYNSGLNVTGPGYKGSPPPDATLEIANFLLDVVCTFAPIELSWICWLPPMFLNHVQPVGVDANVLGAFGNGQVYEHFVVTGGPSPLVWGINKNVLASFMYVEVHIPYNDWGNQPQIVLQSQNVLQDWKWGSYQNSAVGATGRIVLTVLPSVLLTGTVSAAGHVLANQLVTLEENWAGSVIDYQVQTNSQGKYTFFARPTAIYKVSSSYSTSFGSVTGSTLVTTPSNPTSATCDIALQVSSISGTVTDASTGRAINYATVVITQPYPPGSSIGPTTNSAGVYFATVNLLGTYAFSVGHSGYNTATGSFNIAAWNIAYSGATYPALNFALTPTGGGGGGGCILSGSKIALGGGGTRAVDKLQVGDSILGYDPITGSSIPEKVTSNTYSYVNALLFINKGLLAVTLWDQPLYVRNGTWTGWVHDPQNLTVGEQILLPSTGSWITLTELRIMTGTFKVYDLRATTPNDFVANGILVGDKPIPK